jgi:anthranilate phosphoribosyltransferase
VGLASVWLSKQLSLNLWEIILEGFSVMGDIKVIVKELLSKKSERKDVSLDSLSEQLRSGKHLTIPQMTLAMLSLIEATSDESERLNFLRELRPEVSNSEMLATAAAVLLHYAPPVLHHEPILFDCVGTGGDRLGLYNLSTLASLVVAACGVKVAKHGNRAITSGCGAADLLQALSVPIEISPEESGELIRKLGITCLFAPLYHQATRNVQPLRLKLKQEGIVTLFNLLGPLTNPACPSHRLLGVYHPDLLVRMAEAVQQSGCCRAWVVSGQAAEDTWMDEISPCGLTRVVEVTPDGLVEKELLPDDFGISPIPVHSLTGGDVPKNLQKALEILNGEISPYRDAICMNTAVGLMLVGRVKTLLDGMEQARKAIDSRAAFHLLDNWRSWKPGCSD